MTGLPMPELQWTRHPFVPDSWWAQCGFLRLTVSEVVRRRKDAHAQRVRMCVVYVCVPGCGSRYLTSGETALLDPPDAMRECEHIAQSYVRFALKGLL